MALRRRLGIRKRKSFVTWASVKICASMSLPDVRMCALLIYIYIYICECVISVWAETNTSMKKHVCICIYIYVYIYMYSICIYSYVGKHTYMHTRMFMFAYLCTLLVLFPGNACLQASGRERLYSIDASHERPKPPKIQ